MQRLIRDPAYYSRVGTRGIELVDASSEYALGQALLNLRGAIAESRALVTNDALPPVSADERQLIQLFQNLIGNAIKYQRPAASRVSTSPSSAPMAVDGNSRCVTTASQSIRATSTGFSACSSGCTNAMNSTAHGIGLAICKKIVERHGGTISVESRPGDGATFRFTLEAAKGKH